MTVEIQLGDLGLWRIPMGGGLPFSVPVASADLTGYFAEVVIAEFKDGGDELFKATSDGDAITIDTESETNRVVVAIKAATESELDDAILFSDVPESGVRTKFRFWFDLVDGDAELVFRLQGELEFTEKGGRPGDA